MKISQLGLRRCDENSILYHLPSTEPAQTEEAELPLASDWQLRLTASTSTRIIPLDDRNSVERPATSLIRTGDLQ